MKILSLLLNATALLVLVPTTLAASMLTLIALPVLYASAQGTGYFTKFTSMAFIALILAAGWYGLATLWMLYAHFKKHSHAPSPKALYWLGLISGSAVSLLLLNAGLKTGNTYFMAFGLPLIAAGFFAYQLRASGDSA